MEKIKITKNIIIWKIKKKNKAFKKPHHHLFFWVIWITNEVVLLVLLVYREKDLLNGLINLD